MANLVDLIFSNSASVSPQGPATCHLQACLYQLGKEKKKKRLLSCQFLFPKISLFLAPYPITPISTRPFNTYVTHLVCTFFKTSMTMRLEPAILPPRRVLLFPFCHITFLFAAHKTPPCLVEYAFFVQRHSNGFVFKECLKSAGVGEH